MWSMSDCEFNIQLLFCVNSKLNGFMLFTLESKSTKRRIGEKAIFMTVMKTHSWIGLDPVGKFS